jgi:hypothetical protein
MKCKVCCKEYRKAIFVNNDPVIFALYKIWKENYYNKMCFDCYCIQESRRSKIAEKEMKI